MNEVSVFSKYWSNNIYTFFSCYWFERKIGLFVILKGYPVQIKFFISLSSKIKDSEAMICTLP